MERETTSKIWGLSLILWMIAILIYEDNVGMLRVIFAGLLITAAWYVAMLYPER